MLRPEPGGLLWFHRRSAETLELDAQGMGSLQALLAGRRVWGLKAWSFRNLLLARGFLRRSSAPSPVDSERLALCRQAAESLDAPLRSRTAPEVLHISLTDACNQSCGGCFFSNRAAGVKANIYLPGAMFAAIVAAAARHQVFQLALGGGEPLMHPELEAMVRLAVEAGLVVNLTSSGSLLTAKKAAGLKAAGLSQLQLSLNGSQAEIHQQTRPGFEAVLRAAELCRAAGLRFGFNLLVTRGNAGDLEAMLALAERLGAYSVNVLRPKPSPAEPDWLAASLPNAAENRRLQAILRRWQGKGSFLLQTDTSLTFLRQGSAAALNAAGLGGCSAGRRMLSIGVDGRVSPCSHVPLYDEGLRPDAEHPFDLVGVWQRSAHLDRFRRLEETLTGACADCDLKPVCRGCRAIVWARTGQFDGEDAQCPKLRPI